jgi:hypothetical protein
MDSLKFCNYSEGTSLPFNKNFLLLLSIDPAVIEEDFLIDKEPDNERCQGEPQDCGRIPNRHYRWPQYDHCR